MDSVDPNERQPILIRAFQFLLFIRDRVGGYVSSEDKMRVFAALFTLAIEHQASILYLLEKSLPGSSFALVRPLTETVYRAFWSYFCANPKQFAKVLLDDRRVYPGFENMGKAINKKLADTKRYGEFFLTHSHAFGALSSYTHSGMMQIGRRFDAEGNLRATFTQVEIDDVISATIQLLAVFAVQFFHETGRAEAAEEVTKKYNELFGAG